MKRHRSAFTLIVSEQLGRLINPNTARELAQYRTLVPQLLNWFAKYENGIAETFGTAYREKCLAARNKPNWVEPKQMGTCIKTSETRNRLHRHSHRTVDRFHRTITGRCCRSGDERCRLSPTVSRQLLTRKSCGSLSDCFFDSRAIRRRL